MWLSEHKLIWKIVLYSFFNILPVLSLSFRKSLLIGIEMRAKGKKSEQSLRAEWCIASCKKQQSYPRGVSCLLRGLVLSSMSCLSENIGFQMVPSGLSMDGCWLKLLQAECARFLYSSYQLLVQHGEGRVRWEVQTIKASMSPVETYSQQLANGCQ